MNILFIGLGNMGSAVAQALLKSADASSYTLFAVDPVVAADKNAPLHNSIKVFSTIGDASAECNAEINAILLAVKPQIVFRVLEDLNPHLSADTLLISTVAGISIDSIAHALVHISTDEHKTHRRIARIMPNIAAKTQESLTGLSFAPSLDDEGKTHTRTIIANIGTILEIPERLMSAVTGVSGSGIAFAASFVEALAMAGVREGLSYAQSYEVSLQTIKGLLSLLLASETHTAEYATTQEFITSVCSPGGTTIEGLVALQEYGLQSSVFAAVHAATEKSEQFSRNSRSPAIMATAHISNSKHSSAASVNVAHTQAN